MDASRIIWDSDPQNAVSGCSIPREADSRDLDRRSHIITVGTL